MVDPPLVPGLRHDARRDPVYLYTDDLVGILPSSASTTVSRRCMRTSFTRQRRPQAPTSCISGNGTGYYTAVMAHLVGPSGRVTGIEYEPELAARPKPISQATQMSKSSKATAHWFRSMKPMSFTSMPAARGRPKAGSIASPRAGA